MEDWKTKTERDRAHGVVQTNAKKHVANLRSPTNKFKHT